MDKRKEREGRGRGTYSVKFANVQFLPVDDIYPDPQ